MRPRVSLYCTEGGADKVYTLWVEPRNGGHFFVAQYGPRGGSMQEVLSGPLDAVAAEKMYDKKMKEKRSKGYHEGENAPAFNAAEGNVDTGLRPMLLEDATADGPEKFLTNDWWCAQEKMDGKRIMLRTGDKVVSGSNRRGLICPIPASLAASLIDAPKAVIDGELIGETFHAFDLVELIGDIRAVRFGKRHDLLLDGFSDYDHVRVVPRIYGEADKRRLLGDLQAKRKEGIVFKLLGGQYAPGRSEECVKVKFYAEGLFRVAKWNEKSSIQVEAFDPQAGWTGVGNVTVHTRYASQITPGRMVRVKYLYATAARILYQPNLDPTADGTVCPDDVTAANVTPLSGLKLAGKEEA